MMHMVYQFELWIVLTYLVGMLLGLMAVLGMSYDQLKMRDRVARLEKLLAEKAEPKPKPKSDAKYPALMPKPYVGKHSA